MTRPLAIRAVTQRRSLSLGEQLVNITFNVRTSLVLVVVNVGGARLRLLEVSEGGLSSVKTAIFSSSFPRTPFLSILSLP